MIIAFFSACSFWQSRYTIMMYKCGPVTLLSYYLFQRACRERLHVEDSSVPCSSPQPQPTDTVHCTHPEWRSLSAAWTHSFMHLAILCILISQTLCFCGHEPWTQQPHWIHVRTTTSSSHLSHIYYILLSNLSCSHNKSHRRKKRKLTIFGYFGVSDRN